MALGGRRFVELTRVDYDDTVAARQRILNSLHIEQKFHLALANYAELEAELLRLANMQLVYGRADWNNFHDDLYEISRRLINLLTTCRLYIDQSKHDIKAMYGRDSTQYVQLTTGFSTGYDTRLGYRVMEELRNHVQHRSLPLHGVQYKRSRANSRTGDLWVVTCKASIGVNFLRADGGFKATILAELQGIADNDLVELIPLVREYVTALSKVHDDLRTVMEPDVRAAEDRFNDTLRRYTEVYGENTLGLAVVEENADHVVVGESAYLVPEILTRRRALQTRLTDYRRSFVSGQVLGDLPAYVPQNDQ